MHRLFRTGIRLCRPLAAALVLLLAPLCPPGNTDTSNAEELERTVAYLMQHVARSNVMFMRNGNMHTPEEAAAHMRRKYEYFKGDIRTPEDFIRLCASKSTMTGRPYQIKLPDGRLLRTDQWMFSALGRYRRETGQR